MHAWFSSVFPDHKNTSFDVVRSKIDHLQKFRKKKEKEKRRLLSESFEKKITPREILEFADLNYQRIIVFWVVKILQKWILEIGGT